jgi:2-polyprenyl-6-methoxyphenol hydroxylase-like FAD-dependent oxidoreductase
MLQYLGQGACMAVEDAVCLAMAGMEWLYGEQKELMRGGAAI